MECMSVSVDQIEPHYLMCPFYIATRNCPTLLIVKNYARLSLLNSCNSTNTI